MGNASYIFSNTFSSLFLLLILYFYQALLQFLVRCHPYTAFSPISMAKTQYKIVGIILISLAFQNSLQNDTYYVHFFLHFFILEEGDCIYWHCPQLINHFRNADICSRDQWVVELCSYELIHIKHSGKNIVLF